MQEKLVLNFMRHKSKLLTVFSSESATPPPPTPNLLEDNSGNFLVNNSDVFLEAN